MAPLHTPDQVSHAPFDWPFAALSDTAPDPLVQHFQDYDSCRTQFDALCDDRVLADDPDRLIRVLTLIEANLIVARHRLEHTPPSTPGGLVLLLRHALSITVDAHVAAILKSCLLALTGSEAACDDSAPDQEILTEDSFDDIVNWGLLT